MCMLWCTSVCLHVLSMSMYMWDVGVCIFVCMYLLVYFVCVYECVCVLSGFVCVFSYVYERVSRVRRV